jgi:class III poly(R)-hydroxyalkanoic acid synthase PhaE subunit
MAEKNDMLGGMFDAMGGIGAQWMDMWKRISEELAQTFEPLAKGEGFTPEDIKRLNEALLGSIFAASEWAFHRDTLFGILNAAKLQASLLRFWIDLERAMNVPGTADNIRNITEHWRKTSQDIFKQVLAQPLVSPIKTILEAFITPEQINLLRTPFSDTSSAVSKVTRLWLESFERALESIGSTLGGRDLGRWKEVYEGWKKAYDETVGKPLHIPQVGPARVPTELFLHAVDSGFRFLAAMNDFYLMLQSRWLEAMEVVAEQMPRIYEQEKGAQTFRKFYELVISTAEKHYNEMFRSASFKEMLALVLDTMLDFTKNRRELLDWILSNLLMPTRAEVDELQKEVFFLKKRLKQLKTNNERVK